MPGWTAIIIVTTGISVITAGTSTITIASTGIAELIRGGLVRSTLPRRVPRGHQARPAPHCFPDGGRAGTFRGRSGPHGR